MSLAKTILEKLSETVVAERYAMTRAEFDALKKGDTYEITWDDSWAKSQKATVFVKSRSTSKKYNTDKVSFGIKDKPRFVGFFLYSRDGGEPSFAVGDMGAVLTSIRKVSK